jgi:hypothetical protein
MRKYDVKGSIETLRTLPSEITLNEFIKITTTDGGEARLDYNYYLNSFGVLGLTESFLDIMDIKTLVEIIKDFQEDFVPAETLPRTITIEGKEFSAFKEGEEFVMNARNFASIENRMKEDGSGWISYAMAILFRKENTPDTEHKSEAHTRYKQVIFGNEMTMDFCLPYVMAVSKSYLENIQMLATIK